MHTPFTEKQPFVRLMPFANVEDAMAEVTLRSRVCSPPAKVEVAVEEVAV